MPSYANVSSDPLPRPIHNPQGALRKGSSCLENTCPMFDRSWGRAPLSVRAFVAYAPFDGARAIMLRTSTWGEPVHVGPRK